MNKALCSVSRKGQGSIPTRSGSFLTSYFHTTSYVAESYFVGKAQIYFHLKEREPGSYDKTLTSATSTPPPFPPANPKHTHTHTHTHMVRNLLCLLVASFMACWRLSPVILLRSLSRCMTTLKTAAYQTTTGWTPGTDHDSYCLK